MRVESLLIGAFLTTTLFSTHRAFTAENPDRPFTQPNVPSAVQRPDAQPAPEAPSAYGKHSSVTNWKSPENEIKLGRAFAVQLEQSQRLVRDPVVNDYMAGITQKLARACGAPFPISVKVIETEDVNAVALPGGFIFINSGLVNAAEDESELASALAHQMAHTCAHQLVRGMSSQGFNKALTASSVVIDDSKSPVPFSGSVSFSLPPLTQNFPLEFEVEADALALQYLYRAGYDPGALLTLFARLNALEKANPDVVPNAFASHLQASGRVQKARRKIKSLPHKDQYIVNSSEFDTVRARLLVLLARRHRNQTKHSGDRSN